MASFTMLDVAVLVGGHDFSTDLNEVSFSVERGDLEVTTFRSGGSRARIGGLRDVSCDVSGNWQSDDRPVDATAFDNLGAVSLPVSVCPTDTPGDTAYMFQAGQFSYELLGAVGDVTPFSLSMLGVEGREGAVRGQLSAIDQVVSGTGGFGSLQFTAPASGQFVYAVVHVLEAGTTLTLTVESDDNSGFTTATTRFTFPAIIATGGYWMTRLAGPFTGETFWRFNATAVTGSFTVSCAIGVQ